jgi:hypothetical protein
MLEQLIGLSQLTAPADEASQTKDFALQCAADYTARSPVLVCLLCHCTSLPDSHPAKPIRTSSDL